MGFVAGAQLALVLHLECSTPTIIACVCCQVDLDRLQGGGHQEWLYSAELQVGLV